MARLSQPSAPDSLLRSLRAFLLVLDVAAADDRGDGGVVLHRVGGDAQQGLLQPKTRSRYLPGMYMF
jgi:hypothetical protein